MKLASSVKKLSKDLDMEYFSRRHTCVILCGVLGIVAYLNTLQGKFVYDDTPAIKNNKDLLPETPWSQIFSHDFWGGELSSNVSHKSYRPLCVATFRLNYMVHGLDPTGYHLVNVLLHGAVCMLYCYMCSVVSHSALLGLLAGLLFAVHPIHTEAVSCIDVLLQ